MPVTTYVCDRALLPDGTVADDVAVTIEDGRFTDVSVGVAGDVGDADGVGASDGMATRLTGLVLPGFADAHSHAFHRALRGRTHDDGRGSFWTWRDRMYTVAARLDPDRYLALARATFAESVLAGCSTIGEFHYLHHRPDGGSYVDPNEMGHALVQAASDAGVRLTLLDTCYLAGGPGQPLGPQQRRFSDGDAGSWAARVEDLHRSYPGRDQVVIGTAIHSVRAVPPTELPIVAAAAAAARAPLHVHLSEQPAENEVCQATYGRSPTALLADAGVWGPHTTAVHATHVVDADRATLAAAGSTVCLCPTTERDLADGVGRADLFHRAGIPLALGSDSRAVVDPFEEARATELDLRLVTGQRGHLATTTLAHALTTAGHHCLGYPDAGRIEVGARADLVAVGLRSVRTAGAAASSALATVLYAGAPADVTDVVVDGRHVVAGGEHQLGDVGRLLHDAITDLLEDDR